ncbi:MAG: class I SAM-dependent methyltransferase [Desulfovibrio sp.]|nr:class I SAM-dependent methyltransferase [Desulfovibrio sp.]
MTDWYASATGICALRAQRILLRHIQPRRRRTGSSLLEINCGEGLFFRLLEQCGFDITATDQSPERRAVAATVSRHVNVMAACDDHLPFEDDAFDHVLLHLIDNSRKAMDMAMEEAFRVAKASMQVTFWNALSLPCLIHRFRGHAPDWPDMPCSWWRVWRKLKSFHAGRLNCASAMACPEKLWHTRGATVLCNAVRHFAPLGAWSVILLDMAPPRTVTPLPLRLEPPRLPRPEPALEYDGESSASMKHVKTSTNTP